ncbi:hypothetical protein D3C76_431830 [compost metagenome]
MIGAHGFDHSRYPEVHSRKSQLLFLDSLHTIRVGYNFDVRTTAVARCRRFILIRQQHIRIRLIHRIRSLRNRQAGIISRNRLR